MRRGPQPAPRSSRRTRRSSLREDRDGRKREPLGWKVFVEQPVTEVYAALQAR
jgi:hypothetical protein